MARDRRPQDGSRPQLDYYEYKRMREANTQRVVPDATSPEPRHPAEPKPEKKSLFGGVKQAVAGFGARADDEAVASVPIPEVVADITQTPAPIAAPIDIPVDIPVDAPVDAPARQPSPLSQPVDVDESPLLDELDELDERSDNPFADTIAGIKKIGGLLKKLSGSIKQRMGRSEDEDEEDEQVPLPVDASYARPQAPIDSADAADEDAPVSRRARRAAMATVGLVEDAQEALVDAQEAPVDAPTAPAKSAASVALADDEANEDDVQEERPKKRKPFSLFGRPSLKSANQDDDDDEDDDIAPTGGRVRLFGRHVDRDNADEGYDSIDDSIDDEDDGAAEEPYAAPDKVNTDLSRQLAESLDGETSTSMRRSRRALVQKDEPQVDPQAEPQAEQSGVDEPTRSFAPVQHAGAQDDEQRTRKFRPIRIRDEIEDEPALDDEYEADDEPVRATKVRKRFGFTRRAKEDIDEGDDEYDDDYGAEEEDDVPTRRSDRRKRFGHARQAVENDGDYDDFEADDDEDDLPVRRYGGGKARGKIRVYQDEDMDDEDDDEYEEDDFGDDEYDEDDERLSFGKRVLRFLKVILVIVLILLIAALTLRQLEASDTISLNWLRGTVGVLVPLDGVFPSPAPTDAPLPEVTPTALPEVTDAPSITQPNETADPAPSADPTQPPYEGIAIGDPPATTARAEFVEDEDLEAVD